MNRSADSMLEHELQSGDFVGYDEARKEEIRRKEVEMREFMGWMKENGHSIPPRFIAVFNTLACEVLESQGYIVNLDPGVMPS
jgi:hypothetical protein